MTEMTTLCRLLLEGRPIGMALQLATMSRNALGVPMDIAGVEALAAACTWCVFDLTTAERAQLTIPLPDQGMVVLAVERQTDQVTVAVQALAATPQALRWIERQPQQVRLERLAEGAMRCVA